jgi:signal transduction histidine kinase
LDVGRWTLDRGDSEVQVAVLDTGIGIAPEDRAHVFDEFRQVGQGTAKAEGTGLGLALTKKFVELHGSRIGVESEVGVGTIFTFTLPLHLPESSGSGAVGRLSSVR